MRIRTIEHCVLGGEEAAEAEAGNALVGCAAGSAEAESVATVQAEAVVSVKLGVLKGLIRGAISEADRNRGGEDNTTEMGATVDTMAATHLHHPFRNLVEEPSVLPLVLEHMAGVGLVAVVDGASPTGPRADNVVISFPKAL